MENSTQRKKILLLGGGMAHTKAIPLWNENGFTLSHDITLVSDQELYIYNGMIPGLICQEYKLEEISFNLKELCQRCNVTFVQKEVVVLELAKNRVKCNDQKYLNYDIISINVGAATKRIDQIKGARKHSIPMRPIHEILPKFKEKEDKFHQECIVPIAAIIGSGVSAVEMTLAINKRLSKSFSTYQTKLIANREFLVSEKVTTHILEEMTKASIQVLWSRFDEEITDNGIFLKEKKNWKDSEVSFVKANMVFLCTGPNTHQFLIDSQLPLCDKKFVKVNRKLQIEGLKNAFASGDCVTIDGLEEYPKSGSGAGASGLILLENVPLACAEKYEEMKEITMLKSGPSINLFNGKGIDLMNLIPKPTKKDRDTKDFLDRRFIKKYHPEWQ